MQKQSHRMIIYDSLSDDLPLPLWNTISLRCEFQPERPEKSGPCWLLKMSWIVIQRVQIKGVLPCWFVGLVVPVQDILLWLAHTNNYFFPRRTLFQIRYPPIAQQAGQAVVLGRLSISMCLWVQHLMYIAHPALHVCSERGAACGWCQCMLVNTNHIQASSCTSTERDIHMYNCTYLTVGRGIHILYSVHVLTEKINLCRSDHK
jgi:hypothetical protein